MTNIEMEDKTGQIRDPKDFQEARRVITNRIVTVKIPQDIELYMQFTTILDALKIAERAVARRTKEVKE
jgi:hypothetical protein